jgi:hypothetical protein
MKMKILSIALVALMIGNIFIVSADFIQEDSINESSDEKDVVEIRVAIYTDEKENEDFYGPYGRTRYFVFALENYSWQVGNKTYCFKPTLLTTNELLDNKLTVENFDVLLYPPETEHYKSIKCFSRFKPNYLKEKRIIIEFVEDGGGVFGTCGGSMIFGDIENEPDTYVEKSTKNSALCISPVNTETNIGLPLICELAGLEVERVGSNGAYYWYSGWNASDYDINYHTLVCLDVPIDKNHPIFDDNIEDTRRMRWIAGGPLVLPENPDREINVIATFPSEEISDNESTQIHYWSYNGGVLGLIKGILNRKQNYFYTDFSPLLSMYCFAEDWNKLDKIVETNYANRPFFTTEIYPNENKARIARCTGHVEHNVWWGGYIEEAEDTDHNNQYEAFYKWKDIIPENETEEDEFTYNYCIIRRSVAWASQKVPDNDLPTIYGESQVSDFKSENQPLNFNVTCNVKIEEDPIELDLYYRHSLDNANWSNWTLFGSDNYSSDGFGFEFDSPNGTGYYEFYSIRRVILSSETEVERVPPGADSKVFVQDEQ